METMNKPKQPKQQQWTEKNCTKYETKNAKKKSISIQAEFALWKKNKNETKFYSGGGDNGKSIIIIILYESLIEYESTTICVRVYLSIRFSFILSQCRFLKMRWKLKSFFFAHFEYQTHIHAHLNFSTHYRPIIHQKQKIRRWSTTRESKMIKKSIASIS